MPHCACLRTQDSETVDDSRIHSYNRVPNCAHPLIPSELTNLMKLSTVELKALALVLKDLSADASRADIIKGLQKVIDDYVPPEVRVGYDRAAAWLSAQLQLLPFNGGRCFEPQEPVKVKRPPSAYNRYISAEVPKYMKAHPGLGRTECFKAVAAMWKDDPSNPKNAPAPPAEAPAQKDDAGAAAPSDGKDSTADKDADGGAGDAAPAATADTDKQGEADEAPAAESSAGAPAATTDAAKATGSDEKTDSAEATADTGAASAAADKPAAAAADKPAAAAPVSA